MSPWTNPLLWVALAAGLVACRTVAPPEPAPRAFEVRHADPAGAAAIIREGGGVVLDVRTPAEFAQGHLPGAINIDINSSDFESRLGALDRKASCLVYCRSGNRSTRSLEAFERLGFQSVVHLDGGLTAWQGAGQAVER